MDSSDEENVVSETAFQYSNATTIHGIGYIFEAGLWVLERLFWIVVVGLGIFFAILLSVTAYFNWQNNPVLTSVATTGRPIETVEFPAITICAQVSPSMSLTFPVISRLDNHILLTGNCQRDLGRCRRPAIQNVSEVEEPEV